MEPQAINLAPVLDAFTTDNIPVTALVQADSALAEQMLANIDAMRRHLQSMAPETDAIGQVKNEDTVYTVCLAVFGEGLPHTIRGVRVTLGQQHELQSFLLLADLGEGELMPIDFEVDAENGANVQSEADSGDIH